jgi:hypothetical protein
LEKNVVIISDIAYDRATDYIQETFDTCWSISDYLINQFTGRFPMVLSLDAMQNFNMPFGWVMVYLILAYCIGEYVRQDMNGFGMYMMVKSRNRSYWWMAKVIWCVALNVCYFLLMFLTSIAYGWTVHGSLKIAISQAMNEVYWGDQFLSLDACKIYLVIYVIPIMVGIVQSLIQMILCVWFDGSEHMIFVISLLVLSTYYGNPGIPHGYAMFIRYFSDYSNPSFEKNNVWTGLIYTTILMCVCAVVGGFAVKKKNIYGKIE